MLRWVICAVLLALAGLPAWSVEEKKDPKDPLSKFSAEDLADPGKSCQKFFEAIGSKDAPVVKALLAEVPKNLEKLDLTKEADKEAFVKAYTSYKGATVTASQRFAAAGIAQVTYQDTAGKEKTLRMQNVAGVFKVVGD